MFEDNVVLRKELTKQVNLVDKASKYEKERNNIIAENEKLYNQVENIKAEYKKKELNLEWNYQNTINSLEQENNHLYKVIDRFKETISKFIKWICKKI